MDDHSDDKQQLYEVSEMKEFKEDADDEEFVQQMKDAGYVHNPVGHQSVRQTLVLVLLIVVVILLGLVLLFQAATMYQVSTINPSAADCSSSSTAAGNLQGNGNVNGGGVCSCDFTELLKTLNSSLSQSDMQSVLIQNNTDALEENLETTQDAVTRLQSIVGTLANIEDNSINTGGTINDILLKVEQVLRLQNGSQSAEYKSCQEIKTAQPDSPSSYYHINSQIVYCEMGGLCNDTNGGWTRLAYLDMADSTVGCPTGLNLVTSGIVRACGRPSTSIGNCASVKFPSNGISYSEVCGRVVGYQYNSPDAVDTTFISPDAHINIDSNYVDGVSITRGFPRTHVWTLMGGLFDSTYSYANCPCNVPPGDKQDLQSFVGSDYFCESGNTGPFFSPILYTADPLWDGKGCGVQEGDCCLAAGLPWFHKTLTSSTTDYIEMRLCGDQATWDEDVPVSFYEIYVK